MNYERLLEGKKALITAGADGIGYAIAKRFDKAGAKVFVCDINEDAVNKVNDVDDNIKAMLCDLRQTQLIASMVEAGFEDIQIWWLSLSTQQGKQEQGSLEGVTEVKQKQQYMGEFTRPDIPGRKFEPTFIFEK